jgi:rubrerythrin
MDVFQFAMEKEKFSEDYYRKLAEKSAHKGLRNIFTMLADEENKHYKVVEQMSRQEPPHLAQSSILDSAKKIFGSMRESAEKFNFDITDLDLYEKARDIEKQSRQFYLDKANQTQNQKHKEIFKKLANEEQKHLILLQNICDFISKPQRYLENAEFNHIPDYVDGVF